MAKKRSNSTPARKKYGMESRWEKNKERRIAKQKRIEEKQRNKKNERKKTSCNEVR